MGSAGREAVELAASAGLFLDPWQQLVLEVGLAERADGKWAASQVGLVVPRQNGKSAVFEALILAGLFLFGERTVVYSAHEFKTAGETFLRVRSLIDGCPDLSRLVKQVHLSKGAEGIELTTGQRLKVISRTAGSGRGFSTGQLLIDEAYKLSTLAFAALFPTMAAMTNPQLWMGSSAPLDDPNSDLLRRLIKRGRAGAPDLAFLEWSAASADAPDAIQQANPSLGIEPHGTKLRLIEAAREAMDPESFDREFLGIFPEEPDAEKRVIPEAEWNACAEPTSKVTGRVVPAFDLSPDRRSVTFVVAGEAGARVHLELADDPTNRTAPTTTAIVARAKHLTSTLGSPIAVAKGSPAFSLEPDLIAADVPYRVVDTAEHAQACGSFVTAVKDRTLAHLHDDDLNRAVDGAASRDYGDGAWLWSRRKASADITPLVAVTLARWVLISDQPVETVHAAIY